MKKVILAYSGGLDTTCCIRWLKEKGFKVICFSANLGSEFSPSDLRKRALLSGAEKIYIKDLREEFAYNYILPALKASSIYEDKYTLSTALGRPLIAKYLVEFARKEKASFVAHGSTGKGNDQVRLELAVKLLAPELGIIAPLREWELKSRQEEIEYAKKYNLPLATTKEKIYSIDKNIWGVSIEGGVLEDITKEPPLNSYYLIKPPQETKDKEIVVEIEFQKGVPVKLNGRKISLLKIIEKLNALGALTSIGRTDLIENRVVGIKSREVYEAPAAWILHTAHQELESLCLDKETFDFKKEVSCKYAQIVYQGLWFSPLKEALDSFVETTQKAVNGRISLRLSSGRIEVLKRSSPNSRYRLEMATYGASSSVNLKAAAGFIEVLSQKYSL